jgi:hypothetical protein
MSMASDYHEDFYETEVNRLKAELRNALSARVSLEIEVEHWKAVAKALTGSGNYNAGKMEEGLDGQIIKEQAAI